MAASCCVPFYYTPFQDRYIDGGLLSNRPDFVFDSLPENYNIMSFRTKSAGAESNSLSAYAGGIISALLEGADMLQHRNIREVKTITIDVENFDGLDFWGITAKDTHWLISKGYKAMDDFYVDQLLQSDKNNQWDSDKTTDILDNMDQVRSIVALWSMNDFDEVWVSDLNLDWVWPLFPTILKWCTAGINIRVFCAANDNPSSKDEAIRRQLLHVGIKVEDSNPSIMHRGFFFNDDNVWKAVCFILYIIHVIKK